MDKAALDPLNIIGGDPPAGAESARRLGGRYTLDTKYISQTKRSLLKSSIVPSLGILVHANALSYVTIGS
jgi:hypothetical protein